MQTRTGRTQPSRASQLAARFAAEPVSYWAAALARTDLAVQAVVSIDDAIQYLADRDLVYFERGPRGTDEARPGIGRWLSETPPRVGTSPGAIGSQAVEVLAELGCPATPCRSWRGRRWSACRTICPSSLA